MLVGCGQDQSSESDPIDETENNKQNEQTGQNESSDPAGENQENTNGNSGDSSDNSSDQSNVPSDSLDKDRAEVVLTEYEEAFKKVISFKDEQRKQKEFKTKEALVEHFEHFMSTAHAQYLADTYFREKDDGLYVIATEPPVFLKEDQPFTFIQIDDTSATIIQERENQLIGHVKMEYELTKKDNGQWIVKDVFSSEVDK